MSLHPECLRGSWHLEGVQYLWTSNCRSLQAALQTLGSMFDSSLSLNEQTEIWGAKLNNAGQGSTTNPATIPELVMSVAGFTQEKKKSREGSFVVVVSIIWCNSIRAAYPTRFPTGTTRNATQGGPQLSRFLTPSGYFPLTPLHFFNFLIKCQHPLAIRTSPPCLMQGLL